MKVNKLSFDQTITPKKTGNIPMPPRQLFYLGDLSPLDNKPVVSIVGSRAVTPYGRQVTTKLASELAGKGIAIVSGLALGVDALAHQAALEAGGYTVAVLPSPVDSVYPATNRQLARRILEQGGALLSEYGEDDRTEAFKMRLLNVTAWFPAWQTYCSSPKHQRKVALCTPPTLP